MNETDHSIHVRFDSSEWKFIHQVRNVLYEANLDKMTISEFIKQACMKTLTETAIRIQDAAKERPELLEEPKRIIQ